MTDPAENRPSSPFDDELTPQTESGILRLVAQREYSLRSLLELSNELTVSLDLYGIADLALFNLMGQMGTARSALWVMPASLDGAVVLVRAHGLRKQAARRLGERVGGAVVMQMATTEEPLLATTLTEHLDEADHQMVAESEIEIFAPIIARGKITGVIALGKRLGGDPYDSIDLQSLRGSMGMLGVAMENTRLYNQLLEQHRQLRQANENLRELDRLKSEFLNNVNHELRTPLTVIIAYTEALMGSGTFPSQQAEFLKTIRLESEKLNGLMESLLDFSAAMEHSLVTKLSAGNLTEVVREFHRDRVPGVAESLRELACDVSSDNVRAVFDAARVYQILDVLLDNAVKFAPQGSRIALQLTEAEEDDVLWARIDVADDGPGIPADRLDQLFESFRQGDGTTRRQVGGMGMGLALAKKLAEEMGGSLTAHSATGEGATFTLRLPTP